VVLYYFEETRRRSLFKKIFSNILEKFGRRLMGLYKAGSYGGLLGLGIKVTTECFQVLGKYDSLKMELNMCDKKIMILLGRFFAVTLLIK
jgi:hypothetical protein